MRLSRAFVPTLKESPADAQVVSHILMVRGGFIRRVAAGVYSFLPLGWRVLKKIEDIVRDEMNAAGAQEVLMPAAVPAELWQESGRWDKYGKALLRMKDRHERDFCFGVLTLSSAPPSPAAAAPGRTSACSTLAA